MSYKIKAALTGLVASGLLLAVSGCSEQPEVKQSTAQANVTKLGNAVDMPQLQRSRNIRVYLPPGYADSEQRYPVLYMHDGQNLFDDVTSYAGEWQVDEALNQLATSRDLHVIVVGIDNGGDKRMSELSPWKNAEFGDAEGEAYTAFIVDTLKPLIDSTYRTKTDAANTAIMGSSMGGLISHYAVFAYPQVFGKAGIFSPSYWYADAVYDFTRQQPLSADHKLYMLVGGDEGSDMVDNFAAMQRLIETNHPSVSIQAQVIPGEGHNEAFWRSQFPQAMMWLFN